MQATDDGTGDDGRDYTDLTRLPVQALYCDWPDLEQVAVTAEGRHLLLRAPHVTGIVRLEDPVRRGVWCDAWSSCIANTAVLPWPHRRLTAGCIVHGPREGGCKEVAFAVGDAHASVTVAFGASSSTTQDSNNEDDASSSEGEDENSLLSHRVQTLFVGQDDDWRDALRGLDATTWQARRVTQQPLRGSQPCSGGIGGAGHAIRELILAAQDGTQLLCQRDGDVHSEGGSSDAVQTLWRASLTTSQVWPVKLPIPLSTTRTTPRTGDAPIRLFDLRTPAFAEDACCDAKSDVVSCGRCECAAAFDHCITIYDSTDLSPRVSFPFHSRTRQRDEASPTKALTGWRVLTMQRDSGSEPHYLVTLREDTAVGRAKGALWTACLDARMPRRPVWMVSCEARRNSDITTAGREVCFATTMRPGELAVYDAPAARSVGEAVVHTIRYDSATGPPCVAHTLRVGNALQSYSTTSSRVVRAMVWGGSTLHLVCSPDDTTRAAGVT